MQKSEKKYRGLNQISKSFSAKIMELVGQQGRLAVISAIVRQPSGGKIAISQSAHPRLKIDITITRTWN